MSENQHKPCTIHASSMPRIARCPGSAFLDAADAWNAAADLGVAVHLGASRIVRGELVSPEALALAHSVSEKDVQFLLHRVREAWESMKKHFPDPQTEVPMSLTLGDGTNLVGTADVIADCGTHIAVLDWKSGRKESVYIDFEGEETDEESPGGEPLDAHGPQVLTYALLAAAARKEFPTRVYTAVVWLRSLEVDARFYSLEDVTAWRDRIEEIVRRAHRGELRVGSHCGDCPACPGCPAFAQRSLALRGPDAPALTAENVFEVHSLRQALERRCKEVHALVKAFLKVNSPVPIEGDREIRLSEVGRKEVKLNEAAWAYLTDRYTQEELFGILSVGLTRLKETTMAKSAKGTKAKAHEEVLAGLEATGALKENLHEQVKIVKIGEA